MEVIAKFLLCYASHGNFFKILWNGPTRSRTGVGREWVPIPPQPLAAAVAPAAAAPGRPPPAAAARPASEPAGGQWPGERPYYSRGSFAAASHSESLPLSLDIP